MARRRRDGFSEGEYEACYQEYESGAVPDFDKTWWFVDGKKRYEGPFYGFAIEDLVRGLSFIDLILILNVNSIFIDRVTRFYFVVYPWVISLRSKPLMV